MPRDLSADFLAAIKSKKIRPAIFVEMHFTSGPDYLWSGQGTISWNGHDWIGAGSLVSIAPIEEGSNVMARGIAVAFSGIDASILAGIMGEFRVGLPAIVYLGLFDSGNNLIDSPIISWAGWTDRPEIEMDGQTATITVNCENKLVSMNVAVDRRCTNEQIQYDHPGDRGGEFINSIQDTVIYWGRVSPNQFQDFANKLNIG
jgi:hypothetical protein